MKNPFIYTVIFYFVVSVIGYHLSYRHSHYYMNENVLPTLNTQSNMSKVNLISFENRISLTPKELNKHLLEEAKDLKNTLKELCQVWDQPVFRQIKECEKSHPYDFYQTSRRLIAKMQDEIGIYEEIQNLFDDLFDPQTFYTNLTAGIEDYFVNVVIAFDHETYEIYDKWSVQQIIPKTNRTNIVNSFAEQLVEFANDHFACIYEKYLPPFKKKKKEVLNYYTPEYFERTRDTCSMVENGKIEKFLKEEKEYRKMPRLTRDFNFTLMKIITLLSLRNSRMSIINLAYKVIPWINSYIFLVMVIFTIFPIIPFRIMLLFDIVCYKIFETIIGTSVKIREKVWTFQIIERIKSQRPKILKPNQYRRYMRRLRR